MSTHTNNYHTVTLKLEEHLSFEFIAVFAQDKNNLPDRASCAGILLAQLVIFVALGKWASVGVEHWIWGHIIACKKNSGEDVRCKTARQPILFESAGNAKCGHRTLRMWCFLSLLSRTFSEFAV